MFSSFSSNWDDQQYAWLMAVNDTGVFDDTVPYITDMPRCVERISSFVPTDISLTLADFSVTVSDGSTTIVDDPRTIEQVYPEQ
ncbi:MAG: hypothetical protein U5N86_13930 [Planctomycetota bacterium]|nr:hypothetical protein [Planctomycetota bacterium]